MKSRLDEARIEINEIDKEMISLFKMRMEAVRKVAEYKLDNNLDVLDSKREDEIIHKNIDILSSDELEKYYLKFFNGVLESSKDFQKDLIKKRNK